MTMGWRRRGRAAGPDGAGRGIRFPGRSRAWRWGALVLLALGSSGCARGAGRLAHRPEAPPAEVGVHEGCPVERAETLDANGDGRPEIWSVRKGGREVCRGVDLNSDGVVDVWSYFDPAGKVRRREYAFGRDATLSEVRLYVGGVLKEIQQSTTGGGRIDTWHHVERGRVVRSERDSDGDGRVDQWWEYPRADRPDCPVMFTDAEGDGRRDRKAGVDLCAEGQGLPPTEELRPYSPDLGGPGRLPTESEAPAGTTRGEGADAS